MKGFGPELYVAAGANVVVNNLIFAGSYSANTNSGTTATILGNATVNNSVFTQGLCKTPSSSGCLTGGLAVRSGGTLTLNHSLVSQMGCGTSTSPVACLSGALYNAGTLNLNGVTVTGNYGALSTVAGSTTNVTNSTLTANNSSTVGTLSTITNAGTVNMFNTTVNANTVASASVAVANTGTLTAANTILSGNLAGATPSTCTGTCISDGVNGNVVQSAAATALPALASNGGPVQTVRPLPSSSAICAGLVTSVPSTLLTDQRGAGYPRTTAYGPAACVDAGAVQTSYGLLYTQQPSFTLPGSSITPAPALQLTESGTAAAIAGVNISLAASAPAMTTTQLTGVNGQAAFAGISFSSTQIGEVLTASLPLGPYSASTASNAFNIDVQHTLDTLTLLPSVMRATAGAGFDLTVTASLAGVTSANYTGTVTFSSSDATAALPASYTFTATDAGTHTFPLGATLETAGAQSITVTDAANAVTSGAAPVTVSAAGASAISVVSGSGQSAAIGAAFGSSLVAKVADAFGNPVSGVTVTFAAPATGASATFAPATCSTGSNGTCAVSATANGSASATPYSVSATAAGITTAVNLSLTNTMSTASATVSAAMTSLIYGQSAALTASVAPASVAGTVPSGSMSFFEGPSTLTSVAPLSTGSAAYTVTVPAVGPHTYAAKYNGDANFAASAIASAPTVTVAKAASTISGPATQPVSIASGSAGTIPVSITGAYAGAGVAMPSGSISYTVSGSAFAAGTAPIAAGIAVIPVPATVATGIYTVTVNYAGDANYNAATAATVSLQTGKITPVALLPGVPSLVFGTALGAGAGSALQATVTAGGSDVSGLGTIVFTATPAAGPATIVTAATVLPAGAYTLQMAWTPLAANASLYNAATATPVALTITPAVLLVTADNVSSTYGQPLPVYTSTITGFVNGDTAATTVSGAAQLSPASTPTGVGIYAIVPALNTLSAANYTFAFANGSLSIGKAVLYVTANNAASTYGQPLPVFTATMSGFVGSDNAANSVTGAPAFTTLPVSPTSAGVYAVIPATGTLAAANYNFVFANGTLNIGQAAQSITFTLPASLAYGPGATLTLSGAASSGLPVVYAVSGPASLSGTTLTINGTGTVTVTADQPGNVNVAAAVEVVRTLAVTAGAQTITFGALPSPVVYSATPIALTATASSGLPVSYSVSGPATLSGTTLMLNGTGVVTVTASQAGSSLWSAAPNVVQNFTVTAGAQTISFAAPPSTLVYGAAPVSLSATASSGLPVTLTVTAGTGTLSGTSLSIHSAGSVTVTATQAGNGTVSAATPVTQTIVVTRAPLSVMVNNANRFYGAVNPAFSGSLTGVVNGDTLLPSYTTTATANSGVGSYAINATLGDPGAVLGNYTVSNTAGSLSVTPAPLAIAAGNALINYGAPLPALSGSVVGAVAGDTFAESFTVLPTPAATPVVGSYSIVPTVTGSALANYTVTATPGGLTVTPSVTAMSLSVFSNQIAIGAKPNLTATVTTSGPAAVTGSVTFTENYVDPVLGPQSLTMGTVAVSGAGLAQLATVRINAAGTYTIAATYSGDASNAPAASSPVIVRVGVASYSVALAPASLTIVRGQTGTSVITITPTAGYQASLQFNCGTLPAFVTCSFSPNPLAIGGTGGTGDNLPVSTTVTIATDAVTLMALPPSRGNIVFARMLWLPGSLLGCALFLRRRRTARWLQRGLWLGLMLWAGTFAVACGSVSALYESPLGTASVTISASATAMAGSGNSDQTQQITLNVSIIQ